jgi:hypothetical protein
VSTIKMTPELTAALIRLRDAENAFDAASAAEGGKKLRHKNPLYQRTEIALDERAEALTALIEVLRAA